MTPKKPPKPKCPPHQPKFPATDDNGTYTHQCKKCGKKWTKPKWPKGGKK